jgi:BirA family biotin operon repressor/biotin-[acetyl-CoA-carboxylase] ligase
LLNKNRNIIKHELNQLKEADFIFSGIKKLSLKRFPDSIQAPMVLMDLKARKFAREIYTFKTIGSTNETAKRIAESGSLEGTVITAEKQTRGKGRLGRSWHSPPGKGLYFSIILHPEIDVVKMPALSQVAALSVSKVIERLTKMETLVKWPNDCLLNGKKVAGILLEASAELDKVAYVILGIGININTIKKELPSSLRSKATSLGIEAGKEFDKVGILKLLLYELEKSYNSFCKYGLRFIGPELTKKSVVLGRMLDFKLGRKKITGTAINLDENGALRVEVGRDVQTLSAGEVSLRK